MPTMMSVYDASVGSGHYVCLEPCMLMNNAYMPLVDTLPATKGTRRLSGERTRLAE
jgi:hypothetical protein